MTVRFGRVIAVHVGLFMYYICCSFIPVHVHVMCMCACCVCVCLPNNPKPLRILKLGALCKQVRCNSKRHVDGDFFCRATTMGCYVRTAIAITSGRRASAKEYNAATQYCRARCPTPRWQGVRGARARRASYHPQSAAQTCVENSDSKSTEKSNVV